MRGRAAPPHPRIYRVPLPGITCYAPKLSRQNVCHPPIWIFIIFNKNSTNQEEYETTRTGTTSHILSFPPLQYCNHVTLFSKVVSIFIILISTESTFFFYLICVKKRNFVSINPFDFPACLKTFAPACGHSQK